MNPLDHNLHLGTRHGSWPAELDGRFGRLALTVLLRPWLERTAETLEMWARRRREREALMRLDDHVLNDVGLSRVQAEAEWRKPFWRA